MRSVLRLLPVAAAATIAGLLPSPAAAAGIIDIQPLHASPVGGGGTFTVEVRGGIDRSAELWFGDQPGTEQSARPSMYYCLPVVGVPCTPPPDLTWLVSAKAPAHVAGKVDVSVRVGNEILTGDVETSDDFVFYEEPRIVSVTPNSGPAAGGNTVKVNLEGLLIKDPVVTFGAKPATVIDSVQTGGGPGSATQTVTVSAPSAEPGERVDVKVSGIVDRGRPESGTAVGATATADDYVYPGFGVPEPLLEMVIPSNHRGVTAGGNLVYVKVSATELTGAKLYFGDTPAADTKASPNGILCLPEYPEPCRNPPPPTSWTVWAAAPAHAPGKVDLSVRLGDRVFTGTTAAEDDYFYDAPPAISAVLPGKGSVSGGNAVQITVTGELTDDHEVLVGGQTATNVSWRWEKAEDGTLLQQITATVPPAASQAPGTVDVVVRARLRSGTRPTVDIVGATPTSDDYTYEGLLDVKPRIVSVVGNAYTWVGGIATIKGVRFGNLKSVKVGARNAFVLSKSSTQIIILAPPLARGSYPITVTTADGVSAPSTQLLTYRSVL